LIDEFDMRERPVLMYFVFMSAILISWIITAILQLGEPESADRTSTLTVHGIYDEIGHLLTALMIAIGLRAIRLPIPVWSVLLGGVVLDIGHVMTLLDVTEPIAGSSRNGTHSVLAVVLLALIGFLDRRHANVWLGVTLGAMTHLWRDMGTGTVPLAWPVSDQVWGTSFTRYMIGLLGVALAMIGSGALLDVYATSGKNTDHVS
jgi:membrane-bound metal-dependent hydrolase YbcI (DUF457 family)